MQDNVDNEDGENVDENNEVFTLGFSLTHLIILLHQDEILKCLLKIEPTIDIWKESVMVDHQSTSSLEGDDSWILHANCLHLAAKFYPHGLHYILSALQHCKTELIKASHTYGTDTPLHIAARKSDCLALR